MRRPKVFQYVWPAAIVAGLLMVLSDLLGLTTYLPFVANPRPTGFHVISYGVVSWALVMFMVGLIGLYARRSREQDNTDDHS